MGVRRVGRRGGGRTGVFIDVARVRLLLHLPLLLLLLPLLGLDPILLPLAPALALESKA